jgi:hypothetical protein
MGYTFKNRKGVQVTIADRQMLVSANTVRAMRGITYESIMQLIQRGELKWVFDIAAKQAPKHTRDLRFWLPEILDPPAMAKLKLADVISEILPRGRRSITSSEMCRIFLTDRTTIKKRAVQWAAVKRDGVWYMKRATLAAWLSQRWIGGAK